MKNRELSDVMEWLFSLLKMSEIEREDELARRLEARQHILDKRNLDQMLKAQAGGKGNGLDESDSVSKAAKRALSSL